MKSPLSGKVFLSVFGLFAMLLINGCGKASDGTTPATLSIIFTNTLIVNVTSTSAQSGGIVTYNGGATITSVGVCYSSSDQTPTTADAKTKDTSSFDPAGTKSFTSNLSGLTAGTTYYVRSYAINSAGIAYGNVVKFTTIPSISAVTTTVSTLAGSTAGGYLDTTGTNALFDNPQGVVADAQGNVYVADGFNNRIRKITPAGVVTTFAGDGNAGYTDGPAATAEFYAPQNVAIDAQGNIYVVDIGNNVIRKITTAGIVSTFAGNGMRGYVNGAAGSAEFNNPQSVAFDAAGNAYVADRNNNVIRKINTAGKVSTLAGYFGIASYLDGTGTAAEFNSPQSVAVDASGNVYVADLKNYCIRKITPAGVVNTVAGGPVQTTIIGYPAGLAVDAKGNLFVTDENGRVLEISFATGKILYVLAGSNTMSGYVDGTGSAARFNNPQGITVDASENIYVADYNNNVIRKIVGAVQ